MKRSISTLTLAATLFLQAATAQTITTAVGTGTPGFLGDGGPATAALLNEPRGLGFDASGNLFISDHYNYRIRRVTPASVITTVIGNGTGAVGSGVSALSAGVVPYLLTLDAAGNVYHCDASNNLVQKTNMTSGIITTIAGNGLCVGSGGGGVATATAICQNDGVAIDHSGNVIFSNSSGDVVYRISSAGMLSVVAGLGSSGLGDGGAATNAQLAHPLGLAVDTAGNIYIADASHNRIRKISSAGIISTLAGNGTLGFAGDSGMATAARLNNPYAVVADSFGDVFFTDRDNNRVRVIHPSGIIHTIAGNGVATFGGDGGPAILASLNTPAGLAIRNGVLYIADANNNRVRKLSLMPGAISGAAAVCQGATITLGNTTAYGTWSSSSTANATVGSSDGIVTGVATGTAVISYTTYGYTTTTVVTVTGVPAAGPITGSSSVCVGGTTTLTGAIAGGTWSSSAAGATVSGGVVTGITAGSAIISYVAANTCGADTASFPIMINGLPDAGTISAGTPTVCVGATVTMTSTISGGVWSSPDPSIYVPDSIATGTSVGTGTVSYTLTNDCGSTSTTTSIQVIDCEHTAVATLHDGNGLALFPVPADNELFISNGAAIGTVTIRDIYGRTVHKSAYHATEAHIDLRDLPPGTYFLMAGNNKPVAFLKK